MKTMISIALRPRPSIVYGVAASIHTQDIQVVHKMAARLRADSIGINRHLVGDSDAVGRLPPVRQGPSAAATCLLRILRPRAAATPL